MHYNDIEYERDGVRKFAQERFRKDLEKAGWKVVNDTITEAKKGRPPKKKDK